MRAASTRISEGIPTMTTAADTVRNAAAKFTADDVTPQLRKFAASFLQDYDGDFSFLRDMRSKFLGGSLSDRQWAGVLNCIRAQLQREAKPAPKPVEGAKPVPSGYYAVEVADTIAGEGTATVFLRVDVQDEDASFAPGSTVVSSFDPDRNSRPAGFGFLKDGGFLVLWRKWEGSQMASLWRAAVAKLVQDPKECAIAYARRTGRCGVCGRELTNPDSIALGIGPVCASKF